eukprot:m.442019 g.442019  ORF g.442019 m.442019 type:complete len:132 (-) comp56810_c0_seq7:121-516(-)
MHVVLFAFLLLCPCKPSFALYHARLLVLSLISSVRVTESSCVLIGSRFGTDYILREFSSKEKSVPELAAKLGIRLEDGRSLAKLYSEEFLPNIVDMLDVVQEVSHKLTPQYPAVAESATTTPAETTTVAGP